MRMEERQRMGIEKAAPYKIRQVVVFQYIKRFMQVVRKLCGSFLQILEHTKRESISLCDFTGKPF